MTALQIAAEINAKTPRHGNTQHLGSLRFWLAYAAENAPPGGGKGYRVTRHANGQIMLDCHSRHGWFPAMGFDQTNYIERYGSRLP